MKKPELIDIILSNRIHFKVLHKALEKEPLNSENIKKTAKTTTAKTTTKPPNKSKAITTLKNNIKELKKELKKTKDEKEKEEIKLQISDELGDLKELLKEPKQEPEPEELPKNMLPKNSFTNTNIAINFKIDNTKMKEYGEEVLKKVNGEPSTIKKNTGITSIKNIDKLIKKYSIDKTKQGKEIFINLVELKKEILKRLYYDFEQSKIDPTMANYFTSQITKYAASYIKQINK